MFTYLRELLFLVFLVHDRRRDAVINAPSTRFFGLRFSALCRCKRRPVLRLNCISQYSTRRLHVNGWWFRCRCAWGYCIYRLRWWSSNYCSLSGTNCRYWRKRKLTRPWPWSGTGAIAAIEPSLTTIWDRFRRRGCARISFVGAPEINQPNPCSREMNNLAKRCQIVRYKGIGMLVSIYTVTWYESFRGLVNVTLPKIGLDIAYSIVFWYHL